MIHAPPRSEVELEERLSRPTEQVISALAELEGDVMVLGAGGKMGPSLARMARRALDDGGVPRSGPGARQVYAVARFSDPTVAEALQHHGVRALRADCTSADALAELPDAPNVLHLVGQKFGTANDPVGTWGQNVVAAVQVANRFANSRIVVFSTGNVYPRTLPSQGGARESHPLTTAGDYAASCVGRERVFSHAAANTGTRVLLFRLCYACDLRYGVLTDLASRIHEGASVPLAIAHANVIWQGDANALALRALTLAATSAPALNVSGPIVSVRALGAALGAALAQPVAWETTSDETSDALIVNIEALERALPHDRLPLETLVQWQAEWMRLGGRTLNKPTHFATRSGQY